MILTIKNMRSKSAIIYVKNILKKLHLNYITVELGKIEIVEELECKMLNKFNTLLKYAELELVEDKEIIIVEQIKLIIFELIQINKLPNYTFSIFISKKLGKKYSYLSKIFSKQCNINIKEYINQIKVARIKQYIQEDKLTMSEISNKMHFSSLSHLSYMFKKVTNMTPTQFKNNI